MNRLQLSATVLVIPALALLFCAGLYIHALAVGLFYAWLFNYFDESERFERAVEFLPAYDRRHPNPRKNYGICDVRVRFVLKGRKGAVQFLFGSGWFLPKTAEEYKAKGVDLGGKPRAWDLGYHSPKPMFEGHTPMSAKCEVLNGKCYYDGSGLNAEPVLETLIREGGEGVWKKLEECYYGVFGGRGRREADR